MPKEYLPWSLTNVQPQEVMHRANVLHLKIKNLVYFAPYNELLCTYKKQVLYIQQQNK
jgi:hypothetical protein